MTIPYAHHFGVLIYPVAWNIGIHRDQGKFTVIAIGPLYLVWSWE